MFNLNDRVAEWHETPNDGVPLHEYLGFTHDEYKRLLEGRMSPEELASHGYQDQ